MNKHMSVVVRCAVWGVGSLVVGSALVYATQASAVQRIVGLNYMPETSESWSSNNNYAGTNGALRSVYHSLGYGPNLTCPIENSSTDPAANYTHADVYVYDGSSSDDVYCQACSQDGNNVETCGGVDLSSGTGYQTLSPSVSVSWAGTGHSTAFDYVYCHLPAAVNSDNSGWSAIRGIKAY